MSLAWRQNNSSLEAKTQIKIQFKSNQNPQKTYFDFLPRKKWASAARREEKLGCLTAGISQEMTKKKSSCQDFLNRSAGFEVKMFKMTAKNWTITGPQVVCVYDPCVE